MSPPSKIIKLMKNVKPTRMWIDGKSFNILKYKEKGINESEITDNYLEECKANYNIIYTNNLYCTSFRLPGIYYEKLQHFPNLTVNEIELHTNANIYIPHHESDECIVVSSKEVENVIEAREKLHSVFSIIREYQKVQQFISIPVINNDIKINFEHFKKEILQSEIDGLHESIFQKAERLHLTIGVFSLLDETERSEAIKTLNECKDSIIEPIISKNGQLKIELCGLGCMNNDYKKVNILYANAKAHGKEVDDILQEIANSISKHFYDKGLIRQYQENVKIHVTLMNTKYRKVGGQKRRWKDKKKTFNATTIMEKYKDFYFGECDLNEIHLSWISNIENNGFYKPLSVLAI